MRRGEAEVGLWEGRHRTTKGVGHLGRSIFINVHRDECGFMEIDVEDGGAEEAIQEVLQDVEALDITLD